MIESAVGSESASASAKEKGAISLTGALRKKIDKRRTITSRIHGQNLHIKIMNNCYYDEIQTEGCPVLLLMRMMAMVMSDQEQGMLCTFSSDDDDDGDDEL